MAVTKAHARFVKISPLKVRLVLDLIRGKDVISAEGLLLNVNKKGAPIVVKLLQSAVANAKNNNSIEKEGLYISGVYANQGPALSRFRAATMGRASSIKRRTSHITIELDYKSKGSTMAKAKVAKGGKR
ncbi:MAG: 50S ribosomal protein L22 [Candidatus Kaelpia aquatica]|nr:50S ribosomal protein L22 [Candidatus Kaelpia aquatica]